MVGVDNNVEKGQRNDIISMKNNKLLLSYYKQLKL